MTTRSKYYYQKGLEKLKIGKALLLALPFSILLWVIILVMVF